MKIKSFGFVLLIIAIGISLSGCGCFMQAMKGETAPPAAPGAKVVAPEAKKEIPVQEVAKVGVVLKDVNFDFDKYNIRPGDAEILKQNLDWFKASANKKVRIEGNCDERGTVEYNLVLGQKRADSTKGYLINLGVDGKLLGTISYGKEKPVDPGHNEAAWAKNRRAHFLPLQ
ncbi:MAG: OmpA family protein [Proteobacteria bacterium]|nr:OmpA family protein [Pseudomonadota bacterium]